ncbi:head-tail joining protein [Sulfitobacter dubius]|uniref:head-tail joining protein n=1 Tax=Sulfitobacter dubius TaxID=218673 RepID=UPI0022AE78B0|nr:hypothetical protein [Sulfitobacter dubius]MCZ4366623.1 hypothetical protein [Sulfitobacter dubius]
MDYGRDFFDAMPTVHGIYRRTPHEFDLSVSIMEADKAFRTSTREQLIGSDASGVILEDIRIRRGGTIIAGAATYRVDAVMPSSVPGLSDLKLERIEGAAVPVRDASADLPLDEEIELQLDGAWRTVPAMITPSVEVEEVGRDGTRIIVSRAMIAVRVAEAPGVKAGTAIRFKGKQKAVAQALDDGLAMIKLLV